MREKLFLYKKHYYVTNYFHLSHETKNIITCNVCYLFCNELKIDFVLFVLRNFLI